MQNLSCVAFSKTLSLDLTLLNRCTTCPSFLPLLSGHYICHVLAIKHSYVADFYSMAHEQKLSMPWTASLSLALFCVVASFGWLQWKWPSRRLWKFCWLDKNHLHSHSVLVFLLSIATKLPEPLYCCCIGSLDEFPMLLECQVNPHTFVILSGCSLLWEAPL